MEKEYGVRQGTGGSFWVLSSRCGSYLIGGFLLYSTRLGSFRVMTPAL
jgi:hypothetical protein